MTDHLLSICLEVRLENLHYVMLERWLFDLKSSTKAKTFKCLCSWKIVKGSLLISLGSRQAEYSFQ